MINFDVVRRWHLDRRGLPGTTSPPLRLLDGGWHSKIKEWLAIRVLIACDDGGRVGVDHPAEIHGLVSVVKSRLASTPSQPMTGGSFFKFGARCQLLYDYRRHRSVESKRSAEIHDHIAAGVRRRAQCRLH